ncbi:MAG: hypothetical protein U0401_21725 [Anaerolineae bacterium]
MLAHSTHLRGIGEYDAATQIESPPYQRHLADPHPGGALPPSKFGIYGPGAGQF